MSSDQVQLSDVYDEVLRSQSVRHGLNDIAASFRDISADLQNMRDAIVTRGQYDELAGNLRRIEGCSGIEVVEESWGHTG